MPPPRLWRNSSSPAFLQSEPSKRVAFCISELPKGAAVSKDRLQLVPLVLAIGAVDVDFGHCDKLRGAV